MHISVVFCVFRSKGHERLAEMRTTGSLDGTLRNMGNNAFGIRITSVIPRKGQSPPAIVQIYRLSQQER